MDFSPLGAPAPRRNPAVNPTTYKITTVFPGFDLNKIYPKGFTPHEGVDYEGGQIVGGALTSLFLCCSS